MPFWHDIIFVVYDDDGDDNGDATLDIVIPFWYDIILRADDDDDDK